MSAEKDLPTVRKKKPGTGSALAVTGGRGRSALPASGCQGSVEGQGSARSLRSALREQLRDRLGKGTGGNQGAAGRGSKGKKNHPKPTTQ